MIRTLAFYLSLFCATVLTGTTVLIATHDVEFARAAADRTAEAIVRRIERRGARIRYPMGGHPAGRTGR